MTTEQDLYNAFLAFSVEYLENTPDEGVNEKIFDSISKVVLKMEKPEALADFNPGSVEEKRLDDLRAQMGVDD